MPKVSEQHRDARKHQISTAALHLFATKGFTGTSMTDIIEASGLSAGAIYGHYKSKDDLIRFAVSDLLDLRMESVYEGLRTHPLPAPGDVITMLLTGVKEEVGDLGILVQVWAQASLEVGMRGIADQVVQRFLELFTDYLREWYITTLGMSPEDAESSARRFAVLYVGILQGYVVQSAIRLDFDQEAYLAAASAIRPGFS